MELDSFNDQFALAWKQLLSENQKDLCCQNVRHEDFYFKCTITELLCEK